MKAMAGKYLTVFFTQVKNILEYKTNLMLKLLRPILMAFIVVSVWFVLFTIKGEEVIAGFTLESFIVYILIVRYLFSFSPGAGSLVEMNKEIRKGDISMRLVKPLHYIPWIFARNAPIPIVSGSIGIMLVSIGAILFGAPTPTGWYIPLFICAVLITTLLHYAIYLGMGIASFWIYEIFPIERIYKIFNSILSGELIPLTLFGGLQGVLELLPFAGIAFIPAGIYIGLFSIKHALFLLGVQFCWVVILWSITLFMYHKGLKKFEAQGG